MPEAMAAAALRGILRLEVEVTDGSGQPGRRTRSLTVGVW